MNSKIVLGFLVVLLGVAVGWYIVQDDKSEIRRLIPLPGQTVVTPQAIDDASPNPITTQTVGIASENELLGKGGIEERAVVTYAADGFSPLTITIKKGTTVAFMNESSGEMWVASGVHPTHQLLPGFDQLKSVANGGSYEYRFIKIGTWQYHNHVNPEVTAKVVVTE